MYPFQRYHVFNFDFYLSDHNLASTVQAEILNISKGAKYLPTKIYI